MQYDRDRAEKATRFLWAVAVAMVTVILASGWIVGMYAAIRTVDSWSCHE